MSAESRPGGSLVSTAKHPVNVIPNGIHCYDLLLKNGAADPGTQNVIDINVKQIVECKFIAANSKEFRNILIVNLGVAEYYEK